jgi:hypothetical protein
MAATAEFEFDLWNARLGTEPGPSVIREASFDFLARYTALGPLSRDVEASVRQWMEVQFTGVIQDPTQGGSGGEPEDYVTYSDPAFVGCGGESPYRLRAAMPPRFARRFKVRMNVKGFGEADSISELLLRLTTDIGVYNLPIFSLARHGEQVLAQGGDAYATLVRGGRGMMGWTLKLGETDDTALLLEEMTLALREWEFVHTSAFETGAFSLAAADFTLTGAAGLKEYKVLVSRKTTTDDPGLPGITTTKGNAASTGDSVLPTLPAGDIALGHATRLFPLATPLSAVTTTARHDLVYITKRTATGLDLLAGPKLSTIGGSLQIDQGVFPLTAIDDATSYVNLDSSGLLTVDSTAGGQTRKVVARIVAAGGDVTSIVMLTDTRGPNLAVSGREVVELHLHGQTPEHDNRLWAFGRNLQSISGTVDGVATAPILFDAGGHSVIGRVTAFTAPGILRLGNGTTQATIDGEGVQTVGGQEDIFISDVKDPADVNANPWFYAFKRWGGRGANSPDLTFAAASGLDIDITAYAVKLWDYDGRPFHLKYLEIDYVALSTESEFAFALFKVSRLGLQTIFDTSTLSLFHGTPAVARAFRVVTRTLPLTKTDGGLLTMVPHRQSPPVCCIDSLNREGIVGIFSGLVDMGPFDLRLGLDSKFRD